MIDPAKIWASSQLPTLPSVAVRLLDLTKDPDSEIRDVIEAVKTDPAIAAKILKAANSSFFGLRSEVKTIDRAIPLLGTTVATSLALSFSLSDDAMTRGPLVEHYQQYWRQSIVNAAAAEVLGGTINRGLACEFFLCGLLIDLGRLAMLKTVGRDYLPVLTRSQTEDISLAEAETQDLGVNHIEVGQRLMENWKLPEQMIRAAQLHHAPIPQLAALSADVDFQFIAAIATSSSVGDWYCTPHKGRALERLRKLTGDFFGYSEERLTEFLGQVGQRMELAGDVFHVDVQLLGSPAELMIQANEQLAQLALREHVASTQAVVRQQAAEQQRAELETQNRELQKQALHDPLTKLYNRHFFDDALSREVARCQRTALSVGVIFVDVDHFKKLNDTYGHQFGDLVLHRLGTLFQECTRISDVVARYGGEEFVIMALEPTEKGIERLAERLRERVQSEPFSFGGTAVQVTVSVGVALSLPERKEENLAHRLIAVADECLYASKRTGRNKVTIKSLISEFEQRLAQRISQHKFSRWLVARQLIDIPNVSRALLESPVPPTLIGEIGLREKLLSTDQIDQCLTHQQQTGKRFGVCALELGLLTEAQLVHILALQNEDPKRLAAVLIRGGYAPPDKVAAALDNYLLEIGQRLRTQELVTT